MIDALGQKVTAVETKNTEQDTRLTAVETKNTTQDTRLTALEKAPPVVPPIEPPVEPPVEPVDPPPTGGFVWKGLSTVWPTAATTGPRAATTITRGGGNISGSFSKVRFTGPIMPANNTVLTDCIVEGYIDGGTNKYTLQNCRLDGKGGPWCASGNATVIGCDVSNAEDAIKTTGSGWVIRGNYIHNPYVTASSHNDGVQIQWGNSNGIVEQNYITWTDTSEVFCQELTGQIDNITVRHNWLGGSDLPLRIEAGCTNCKATENVIKKGHWGYYDLNSSVVHHDNIDAVSGAKID
jgi:hypothetical protein